MVGNWFPSTFMRQLGALIRKNFLVYLRSRTTTLTMIFIGIFFLLMLLIMDAAVKGAGSTNERTGFTLNPEIIGASTFVSCSPSFFTGKCYDFVWAPVGTPELEGSSDLTIDVATQTDIDQVITSVRDILCISEDKVLQVENKAALDQWILDNPNTTRVAFYFVGASRWRNDSNTDPFMYVLKLNETKNCESLGLYGCDNPVSEAAIPLQTALDASFAKVFNSNSSSSFDSVAINVSFAGFPHPELPNNFNVLATYGPAFLYVAASFSFLIQLIMIVEEKEQLLVDAMRQVGMQRATYWLSWLIVNAIVNTIAVLLEIGFGAAIGLSVFRKTSFGLLFFLFWLSSMAFTAVGFALSALVRTTAAARLLGILFFIVTFIAVPIVVQLVLDDPDGTYDGARSFLNLIPAFPFYQVLLVLIGNSDTVLDTGTSWDDRLNNFLREDAETVSGNSTWTISQSFLHLMYGFLLFMFLAWYLDHVIPNSYGKRDSVLFFLNPGFWNPNGKGWFYNIHHYFRCRRAHQQEDDSIDDLDVDVAKEAQEVRENNLADKDIAILIKGLRKTFGGRLCSEIFSAVRGIDVAIEKDSAWVLLGSNGAGKSTTIQMLTGLTNVTDGDATIFGHSIVDDMASVQKIIGVCPQHDVLFRRLTGREHLELFCSLKGVPKENVSAQIEHLLAQTLLTEASTRAANTYSGGMRRRLSIAIALVGDPRVVFLDEPTTGMDVLVRREVWQLIANSKKGRVIFLTTHSMEEADVLGDRIGVMKAGKLQALGSSIRLKNRFGGGYQMTLILNDLGTHEGKERYNRIENFVRDFAPLGTSAPEILVGGVVKIRLSKGRIDPTTGKVDNDELIKFFAKWETQMDSLARYSLSQSTLEEVFLNLAGMNPTGSSVDSDHETDSTSNEPNSPENQSTAKKDHSLDLNSEAPESKVIENRNVSIVAQSRAMIYKSVRYQLSQKLGCCALVLVPVVIMVLLIVVQLLVFTPLQLEALCGVGISSSDCATEGYNLQCVADVLQSIATTPEQPNLPEVGTIDISGRFGGINPNCNELGCFEDLELASYRDIPIFFQQEADYINVTVKASDPPGEDDNVRDWYVNLNFLVFNQSCQSAFDKNFDSSEACEGLVGSDNTACTDEVRELNSALAWIESANGTRPVPSENLLAFCSRAVGVAPPDEYIAKVLQLISERKECEVDLVQSVVSYWNNNNIGPVLENISTRIQGTGNILESYTTNIFTDKTLERLLSLLNVTTTLFTPNPRDIGSICSVPALKEAIKSDISQQWELTDLDATTFVDNFCVLVDNIDGLRGLSFVDRSYSSSEDFHQRGFIDRWFGTEIQTSLMKEREPLLSDEEKYRARNYLTFWSGWYFLKSNFDELLYDYIAYFNNSATADTGVGNWFELVWGIDNGILISQTGRGLALLTEGMPEAFVCNRDEWISDGASLNCPSLLPGSLQLSILDFVSIVLFPYLLMLLMLIIVGVIVYEKEKGLRIAMRMAGLTMKTYWVISFSFYFLQYMCLIAVIWIMGIIARLRFFLFNNSGVVANIFIAWGIQLVLLSFLFSIFFKSSRTSTAAVLLYIILMCTVGSNLLDTLIQDPETPESSFAWLMIFSPLVMIRAIIYLGLAGALNDPITSQNYASYANGKLRLAVILLWMHNLALPPIIWYLDQVISFGNGISQPWNFLCKKSYWKIDKEAKNADKLSTVTRLCGILEPSDVDGLLPESELPEDVKAECTRVRQIPSSEEEVNEPPIRIVRLHKKFGKVTALRSMSLGIDQKQVLALLGHNGAGKTTLLSILTGTVKPTSGTATVFGFDIRSNMNMIYGLMGMCPQHDILWSNLTGQEHLTFYAKLKGLKGEELTKAVADALKEVDLTFARNRRAGRYSGGMKRRLSTAIAIIGNPKVVYLDEPSTGLDPAARRQLWEVISKAKHGKSVILTTHSMEEAEILGDRVAIMGSGQLLTIGVPEELKRRYGSGYTVSLITKNRDQASDNIVYEFMKATFPTSVPVSTPINGVSKFEIPSEDVNMSEFFKVMATAEKDYGIVDSMINQATLEEVFLDVASKEGDEDGSALERAKLS